MAGAQPRTSGRSLFKQLEILPVPCQYILSLMHFIVSNQENFQTDSSIHNINTRNKHHLDRPNANLSCFQKQYILCWHQNCKQFLPHSLRICKNDKAKFKVALRKYINTHSFYSLDEFLCVKMVYNTVL